MSDSFYQRVMDGSLGRGVGGVCRTFLLGASCLYGAGARINGWRRGRKPREFPVPVISVGNITTGGTGKTPAVIGLGHFLRENRKKVAVLSRGYGRRTDAKTVLVSDGKKWRKTAGILAEASSTGNSVDWLLLGIGLNANNRPPLATAVSLGEVLDRTVELDALRDDLIRALRRELRRIGAW